MDVRWRPLIGFPLDIHIWSIGWPMKSPNWKSNGCPNVVHIRSAGRPVEVQIDVHVCALCIVQWTSIEIVRLSGYSYILIHSNVVALSNFSRRIARQNNSCFAVVVLSGNATLEIRTQP